MLYADRVTGSMQRAMDETDRRRAIQVAHNELHGITPCLLYTSDAADDLLCVDLGGRRIIKKKNGRRPDGIYARSRHSCALYA